MMLFEFEEGIAATGAAVLFDRGNAPEKQRF